MDKHKIYNLRKLSFPFLTISFLALWLGMNGCELESIHASIAVDFDSNTDCYQVAFNTNSQGAYSWDFGDGTSSEEQNPVHLYQERGTYEVSLTVLSESGAGKKSKSVSINPAGNPFRKSLANYNGNRMFPQLDGQKYRLTAKGFGERFNSLLDFSANGQFESVYDAGSASRDYLAFFNPVAGTTHTIYNDSLNSTVVYTYVGSGARLDGLFKSDTSFVAHDVSMGVNESVFISGSYTSALSNQSGVFVWSANIFPDNIIYFDFLQPYSPSNLASIDIEATSDGGAVLATFVPGQGIYVLKINNAGQSVWGRYINNSNFQVSTSVGSAFNFEYLVSIVPLTANDFVVGISTRDLGTEGGAVFFRLNETTDSWRTDWEGFARLRDMIISKDGHIMACGAFNKNNLLVPYLMKLNPSGEIQFTKEILDISEGNTLVNMLETDNDEFVLLGNGQNMDLFRVDCGGNF